MKCCDNFNDDIELRPSAIADGLQQQIKRNAEMIGEIAASVRRIRLAIEGGAVPVATADIYRSADTSNPSFRDWLRKTYQDRMHRSQFFKTAYTSNEPAWDILLDLAISWIDKKKISVSSACVASRVPVTTALRWIGLLESDNLVEREADLQDRRRIYLNITDHGLKSMYGYYLHVTGQKEPTGICGSGQGAR